MAMAASMEAVLLPYGCKGEQVHTRAHAVNRAAALPSSSCSSSNSASLRSCFFSAMPSVRRRAPPPLPRAAAAAVRAAADSPIGQDPEWSDDDYLVVGVAHCFRQDESSGKLQDAFLVEPLNASAVECMETGGATSYKHITATTLGVALKQDISLLPAEFAGAEFCSEFNFRARCSARTWKRQHAVENLRHIVAPGAVLSDFNFSLQDKRIINKEHVVTDDDNIKQDLSIDVYGRKKDEVPADDPNAQIASLYNA